MAHSRFRLKCGIETLHYWLQLFFRKYVTVFIRNVYAVSAFEVIADPSYFDFHGTPPSTHDETSNRHCEFESTSLIRLVGVRVSITTTFLTTVLLIDLSLEPFEEVGHWIEIEIEVSSRLSPVISSRAARHAP